MASKEVNALSLAEFDKTWLDGYLTVFSSRDIDKRPFKSEAWSTLILSAPAYSLAHTDLSLTETQCNHASVYCSWKRAVIACGDSELVGFLQGGPHQNPSVFHAMCATGSAIREMRSLAVDGFDLHVFSASLRWGLVVSWEEEVAVLAGDRAFINFFIECAGLDLLKREAEQALSFQTFSAETQLWASRLRESVTDLRQLQST